MEDNPIVEKIDKALLEVEKMRVHTALNARFEKNMQAIKQVSPALYDEYINYQPESLQLSFDSQGEVNVVEVSTGQFVYSKNPQQFCDEQVENYIKNPSHIESLYREEPSEQFFYTSYLNRIVNPHLDRSDQFQGNIHGPIGLMVVFGVGLHLLPLLDKLDIRVLCIIEPHKDLFYASLVMMDWELFLSKVISEGKTFEFLINEDAARVCSFIESKVVLYGQHHLANSFLYRSIASSQTTEIFEQFASNNQLATANGFLEDERTGLAHTINNINSNIPILTKKEPLKELPPVFIVGNGPSLEKLLPFLQKNMDDAIVISCGSAISTLYRAGIAVDFHLEIERTDTTRQIIEETTSQDYRNSIKLVALNTVTPKAFSLFKQVLMAPKGNDIGEIVIRDQISGNLDPLLYMNPTVTNFGLSLCLRMGFQQIYLLGVDLGMKDESHHHAASSPHYDKKGYLAQVAERSGSATILRKGNFSEMVKTTSVLDRSRSHMVMAIKDAKKDDMEIFNLNDGAFIEGTVPMDVETVTLSSIKNKNKVINEIVSHYFVAPNLKKPITSKFVKMNYLKESLEFLEKTRLAPRLDNIADIYAEMDKFYNKIVQFKEIAPAAHQLLNGSIQTFNLAILKICFTAKDKQELKLLYSSMIKIFNEFMQRCFNVCSKHCLTLDGESLE